MKNKFYIVILMLILTLPCALLAQDDSRPAIKYKLVWKRLKFARDVQMSFPNEAAHQLLNNAEAELQRGRALAANRRLRLASRSVEQADLLIGEALKIILKNPINAQHERLKALLDRAETVARQTGNPKARQLLDDARDQHRKAKDLYASGRLEMALDHFRKALTLANQAIDTAEYEKADVQERARRERENLNQLLLKAKTSVESSQNPSALRLFRLAEKQLQLSQLQIENRAYASAIDHYHQATRLLLRVIDSASGADDKLSTGAFEEVASLDELIDNLQPKIDRSPFKNDERIIFLHGQILDYQQLAHESLEKDVYETALDHSQRARKLIERLLQSMELKGEWGVSIGDELAQLEKHLEESKVLIEEKHHEEARAMLKIALDIRDQSIAFHNRNRPEMARASIEIAEQVAKAADRLVMETDLHSVDENVLKDELSRMEKKLANSETTIDKIRSTMAHKFYSMAKDAFDAHYLHVTAECLNIARKVLKQ